MKQGRSIADLATELGRQRDAKRDFVADTRVMVMEGAENLSIEDVGRFGMRPTFHRQISSRLNIPQKYYDRMLADAPGLLSDNVNHWFQHNPQSRMVRTLDDKARAFLSNRYRPIDNYDMAEVVLPIFEEVGVEVRSAEVTESRMYIKGVAYHVNAEVEVGDLVAAGVIASNSEIGLGSWKISAFIERLVCKNGMVGTKELVKYHTGQGNGDGDGHEFFKSDTLKADDKALFLKTRDVVEGLLSQAKIEDAAMKFRGLTDDRIVGDPVKAVEVLSTKLDLSDHERGGVLKHLIQGGDLSAWGVVNAVTRQAEDVESYDRATEIEGAGFKAVELPQSEWAEVLRAGVN